MATAPGPGDGNTSPSTSLWNVVTWPYTGILHSPASTTESWEITYTNAYGEASAESTGHLSVTVTNQKGSIVFSCMEDKPLTLATLRWVAEKELNPSCDDKMIILSYLNTETDTVDYKFFMTSTDRVFIKLSALVMLKFGNEYADRASFEHVVNNVKAQPTYMGTMKVSIQNVDNETSDAIYCEYLVVIDLECLSLFAQSKQVLYQLLFWQSLGANSVEQVKLLPENCIVVYTEKCVYKFQADQDFIHKVRQLTPKKKHLFTDVKEMMELFGGGNAAKYAGSDPIAGRPPKEGVPPTINENIVFPRWSGRLQGQECRPDDDPTVTRLISELERAVAAFVDVEDMQNYWIAMEYDIKDTIENGFIPQTEHGSGGLNPDSAEHLQRAFQDVEDQFKENNIPVAISRLRACRELFKSSQLQGINLLFQKDDMSLLKALYMKSLQS